METYIPQHLPIKSSSPSILPFSSARSLARSFSTGRTPTLQLSPLFFLFQLASFHNSFGPSFTRRQVHTLSSYNFPQFVFLSLSFFFVSSLVGVPPSCENLVFSGSDCTSLLVRSLSLSGSALSKSWSFS